MPKQRIRQTGGDVLVFEGELLLKADNRRDCKSERKLWHEVAVYRVDEAFNFSPMGHELVKVTLCSCEPKQLAHEWVVTAGVEVALKGYAPWEYIKGFPPGERYAPMNERLRSAVQKDWAALVEEVLRWWAEVSRDAPAERGLSQ